MLTKEEIEKLQQDNVDLLDKNKQLTTDLELEKGKTKKLTDDNKRLTDSNQKYYERLISQEKEQEVDKPKSKEETFQSTEDLVDGFMGKKKEN